jgi:hypothetical protein
MADIHCLHDFFPHSAGALTPVWYAGLTAGHFRSGCLCRDAGKGTSRSESMNSIGVPGIQLGIVHPGRSGGSS